MTTDFKLKLAGQILAGWTVEAKTPEPNRLDIVIDAANLAAAVKALMGSRWGYLAAITGLDRGVEADTFEVLYHFCEEAAVLSLRVRIPRRSAKVPTICNIIPSASLYERELREMFGITVEGLADAKHLFLPDDWEEGRYPLRKDTL